MTTTIIEVVAGLLYVISGSYYVYDVVRQKIVPNVVSFILSVSIGLPLLFALLAKDIFSSVPLAIVGLISGILTLFFAFEQHKFYFRLVDKICLIIGLAGVGLWVLTRQAEWSIFAAAVVDVFFFVPIIVKVRKLPQFETRLPWLLNLAAAIVTIFAIHPWYLANFIVPVVQIIGSSILNYYLLRKRSLKSSRV